MRAIRLHEFGPPSNLVVEQLPDPVPAGGQVRIAVDASGVHLIDTVLRRGATIGALPTPDLPMVPGREVAGTVDTVADDVDSSWIGRRVVAHLGPAAGGYASAAVVAATSLHALPDDVASDAAVAMIGTGRTAMAVLDAAAVQPDDVVLITGAAGGLGSLFVQAACNAGATVVAVVGAADKADQVRRLGADHAVDHRSDVGWPSRVAAALDGREVSLVLDGVGGGLGRTAFGLLGLGGRLVMFGAASGEIVPFTSSDLVERGLTGTWAIGAGAIGRPGVLRGLESRSLAELATGRLSPAVQRFPLERAGDAHTAIEQRRSVGKVVLV